MADNLTVAGVPVYRDSAGVLREQKDQAQLASLAQQVASKADASAIPQPATAKPRSEMTGGALGEVPTRYALEDHQHPRLTSTTYVTLGSNQQATATFSRSFVNKPGLNMTEVDAVASSQPLVLRGMAWVQDANGLYIGVTISGSRAQILPTIAPVSSSLIAIATTIAAVNTNVVTPLAKFDVFGGNAAGATVSVIAVARSDVPAT